MFNRFSRILSKILVYAFVIAVACSFTATPSIAKDPHDDIRVEIEGLIAKYLWAFDTFDADTFVALFAKDGEVVLTGLTIPEPIVFHGSEALRAFIEMIRVRTFSAPYDPENVQFSPNIHFHANFVLKTVKGNAATGKAYWFTVRRGENHDLVTEPNPNPSFFASIGTYDQEFVKQNGTWLFKRVVVGEFAPQITPVQ